MIFENKTFSCDYAKGFWKKRFFNHTGVKYLPRDMTPLRYPGGKGSLKYLIANVVVDNKLLGKGFIEPFCGGAGASIPLLLAGVVNKLYLNDASTAIYSFWKSVFFSYR